MTLSVTCPNCKKTIHTDEKYAGKSGACPDCGCPIVAPKLQKAPPASPPIRKKPVELTKFTEPEIKLCQFCAEPIQAAAIKCKHCGEFLRDQRPRGDHGSSGQPQEWKPGIAAVLSFFLPGLGHVYKGKIGAGLGWMVGMLIAYTGCWNNLATGQNPFLTLFLMFLPLILHVICVHDAYHGRPIFLK